MQTYEYKTFFTQEISKRWFKKLNELNARGLIDRTSFTDNYDQYQAKIASGRVLGQSVQGWQFMYSADLANRDRGQNVRTMAPLPIVWNANTKPRYRNITIPNLYRGMGISKSAKDSVRIIRFINDLLSEDVQRTINWGIEGQHWQYDSNKVPYRTAAYDVTSSNELMDKASAPNAPWFPTWNMPNPPDGSAAQIALLRCEQTMKQRLPQMILAAPAQFENLWAAYVNEMNNNGIAAYEAYMQEQLNQRLKEWGIRK